MLQHPQTEEQYLKCGSVMLKYKLFKMFCGNNCFACFNTPKARETFLEIVSTCFSKLDAYQSEDQDISFLFHFQYLCHVFSILIHLISSEAFEEIKRSCK